MFDELPRAVARFRPSRILLVASDGALARTRVLERLAGHRVARFSGFTANPVLEDTLAGCRALRAADADLVIGLGGGSAMDTAKMIRVLPPRREEAAAVLRGAAPLAPDRPIPPLVVVPTTAGTGSEVTRFATVYVQGRKHSLDSPHARPDVAVVDPLLTASCPEPLSFSCAFDALAHALESYWSVRSTPESRLLAEQAGRGLAEVLAALPAPVADRTRLSALSIQAGLAIDRTRTTVGHAFAYPLTARHGIPHGLAAVLALSHLLPAAASGEAECRDPRGAEFFAGRLSGLAGILGVPGPGDLGRALADLIERAGFPTDLGAYGIGARDIGAIVAEALGSNRADNAPVAFDAGVATRALGAQPWNETGRRGRNSCAR